MKNLFIAVALIAALLVGWFGRDLLPQQHADTMNSTASKERKIKYWRAPMDPSYIRNEPGKSPMGMDLIPVYEDDGEEMPGTVKIDPAVVQTIGVKMEKAEKRDLFREIVTIGVVEADEQKINKINPKVSGWIDEMFIDSTGSVVKKDDMLLSLYSPELVSTQEEYLLALGFKKSSQGSEMKQLKESSGKLAKTSRQRLEYFDVPEHQIKEIEKTGKIYKNLHIHSPYAGVVTALNVRKGSHVTPNTILYEITDLSTVWVNADVYEYEIPWVHEGDEVELTFTALPGKVYRGKIGYIYPYLEQKSRTIKVRVVVDNPGFELKPEMFANVKILAAPRRNVVTVPERAVLHSGTGKVLLKSLGNGRFLPVDVAIGIESGGYVEVLSGVSVGDEIVTSSQFLIDSESKLSEVLEGQGNGEKQGEEKEMEMKHEDMDHEGMDHMEMGHGEMNHEQMNLDEMKHEGMDHMEMNHGEMNNHEGMNHQTMPHEHANH